MKDQNMIYPFVNYVHPEQAECYVEVAQCKLRNCSLLVGKYDGKLKEFSDYRDFSWQASPRELLMWI